MPEIAAGIVQKFDDAADAQIAKIRGNALVDRTMYAASEVADFSVLWHLIAATRGVLGAATGDTTKVDEAFRLSAIMGIESALVNGLIKSFFKRARPIATEPRPHALRQPVTSSFPSGHASAAFTAATVLAATSPKRARPLWYALATVIASSRVYVKIHHASDVVGGAILGVALGRLARRLPPKFPFGN